jgi:hypothetical protein
MQDWDPNKMAEHFRVQADDAARYAKEAKGKMSRTNTYRLLFDEHLARWYVFDAVQISSHLASREQAISFFNQLLQNRPTPFGSCDADYFEAQRIKCIKQVLCDITI